jgi:hypothetical protein
VKSAITEFWTKFQNSKFFLWIAILFLHFSKRKERQ